MIFKVMDLCSTTASRPPRGPYYGSRRLSPQAHASPLVPYPQRMGGWGAAYSRLLWAFWEEYRGNITITLPKLHERLTYII